ncbi:MAG: hypothetical protein AB7S78_06550 [Candidatus Omnitrophota bacterium]
MPKLRLRYVFYLIFGLGIFLIPQRPICRINPGAFLFSSVFFIIVVCGLELFFMIRKSYQIRAYLDRGDVRKFLEETEKEINYTGGAWNRCYQINRTAGLYYLGRFEEAIKLLEVINPDKLPKLFRALYVNNYLANLLGAKRMNEAQKWIESNEKSFQPTRHNRAVFHALQSNLGIFKYLKGELQVARYLLEESLKPHSSRLAQAVAYYYLGCIARDEGREPEAGAYFKKAKGLGKDIYINSLIP